MNLTLSQDQKAFVDEVRRFISNNLPETLAAKVAREQHLKKEDYLTWQQALGRRGWLAYTWPKEAGGAGWSPIEQFLFESISSEMNAPTIQPFGPRMVGPIIREFGSEWQKERFLEPIRLSTEWWCQGYSEPSAGSDLASLRMKAERVGDKYVLNGQKIWTSYAHYADWMFCLVRTSQEDRPQKGITFLLVDMRSPGIEVRPIRVLDGTQTFNSVFFTNVEVPVTHRVAAEGDGWTCAKYLLTLERLDNASVSAIKHGVKTLKDTVKATDNDADPYIQLQVADVDVRLRALELLGLKVLAAVSKGETPGGEISALKIRGAELIQDVAELTMHACGYDALPYDGAMIFGRSSTAQFSPAHAATAAPKYFSKRRISIYGGTTEVQKNIIAKRVLGL